MLRPTSSVEVTRTDRAELEIWMAATDVVVQRVKGQAGVELARAIAAFNTRLIQQGLRPHIFNDWEELTGYTSEARLELTAWTAKNVGSLQGIHVLLKSKLVAMGISVANLATGGITKSYSDRATFERVLAEAMRPRGLRP